MAERSGGSGGSGRGPGWYRGDCHVHSVLSGYELTPEQLAAEARAAGLDFLATTEHRSAAGHGAWGFLRPEDGLLVLPGEEMTTRTGHWVAVGLRPGQLLPWDYGVRDDAIAGPLAEVRAAGGLSIAAHPHAPYPSGEFMYPFDGFDLVEVWNGQWSSELPWQADNETALAEWGRALGAGVTAGAWRPAIGDSDAHFAGQLGTPQTVVHAAEFTAPALLAGLRAGRSWIAESASVELEFTATAGPHTAGVGQRLTPDDDGDAPVTVHATVVGVPGGTATLRTDRGRVHQEHLPESGPARIAWRTTAEETAFVRLEVRHPDGRMAALTNPVVIVGPDPA